MVDIKLSDGFELTAAATGDAPVTDELEGFLQNLKVEALTQEGELFYDEEFGWSLLDFAQAEETELNRIELDGRIKKKMSAHEEILSDSVDVEQVWTDERLMIRVRFKMTDESEHDLTVSLDRVKVVIE